MQTTPPSEYAEVVFQPKVLGYFKRNILLKSVKGLDWWRIVLFELKTLNRHFSYFLLNHLSLKDRSQKRAEPCLKAKGGVVAAPWGTRLLWNGPHE